MIQILLPLFLTLLSVFSGSYILYFAYVRNYAKKPWKLEIDRTFQPEISILIPVHNEEDSIESKLRNIRTVSYPKEKMEIIVADDASEDKTLRIVKDFTENNPELNIKVIRQNPRAGKSAALNKALAVSTHSIVIVSDADARWPPDILQKALPYFSDPKIGAVTGYGIIENQDQSWITKGEAKYLKLGALIRLGESKIYSSIRFEGGFCAYRRNSFEKFDCESGSDDSGTALCVIQNGFRAIFVPEVAFVTTFPTDLKGKVAVKARRANQLIWLWIKSLRLMLQRRLLLPKKIAIPEIFLFIINPVIFFALLVVTLTMIIVYPVLLIPLAILTLLVSVIAKIRGYLLEILLGNVVLFYAFLLCLKGKRYVAWGRT